MKMTQCATPCRIADRCDSDPFFLFTPSHQSADHPVSDRITRYLSKSSPPNGLSEKALAFTTDMIPLDTAISTLLSGARFHEQVAEFIQSVDSFGVLMIRPVTRQTGFSPGNSHDLHSLLQQAAAGYSPIWGLFDATTVCGLFPNLTESTCQPLMQSIRDNLKRTQNLTVSIGASFFPTRDFSRHDTLTHALKALNHALLLGPDCDQFLDALSLNISGDALYQQGDITGAIQEFEKALILDPENVNVLNSLGVCFGVNKAYDAALKYFDMALTHNPEEVMAIYNKGVVNLLAGNLPEAHACFTAAEPLGNDIFEVMFQAGKLYLTLGNPQQARLCLERAVQLKPESGETLRVLGQSLMALGMNPQAIAAFSRAIKKNPFDAESLSALGHLYDITGENSEIASVFCSKSVNIAPQNGLYRFRLGHIHLGQDRLDEAMKEFRMASQLGYDCTECIQQIVDIRNQ